MTESWVYRSQKIDFPNIYPTIILSPQSFKVIKTSSLRIALKSKRYKTPNALPVVFSSSLGRRWQKVQENWDKLAVDKLTEFI